MWMQKARGAEATEAPDTLIEQLTSCSGVVPEADLSRGETLLLAAVRHARGAAIEKERRSMRFNFFNKRGFAFAVAGALALGTVGAVGASGGVSDVAGNVGDVLAALNVTDRTPDAAGIW